MSRERALGVVLASTWSVDKAKWGSDKAETLSQDKVAKASSKHGSERGRVHGSGASELGGRGVGGAAGGLDDSAVGGAVGASDRGASDPRRSVGGRGDGAGRVGDRAGSRARHGDGVDAVDGRGHVDGSVVGLSLSSEDTGDKREEEDNDGLEGAHVD